MKSIPTLLAALCFPILLSGQAIHYKKSSEKITILENHVLLNAVVSGKPGVFTLDFGLPQSTVTDTIPQCKKAFHTIENQLFSGTKSFTTIAPTDRDCKSTTISGQIGYDFFRKSQQVFEVNFDESVLVSLDGAQAKDYQEIKSDFRADGIYITVILKWKSYQLKFDTGYPGTIFMVSKDAARFIKEACKNYESLDGNYAVYPNKWITVNGNYYNTSITVADKGVSKIGMGFLKGFNWVIDFRGQKVYLRKNSISLDAQNIFPPDFTADVKNERLKIVSKGTNAKQFQLGQTIEMIEGIPVTPDNICEMKNLLSATQDWDTLEIQKKAG